MPGSNIKSDTEISHVRTIFRLKERSVSKTLLQPSRNKFYAINSRSQYSFFTSNDKLISIVPMTQFSIQTQTT